MKIRTLSRYQSYTFTAVLSQSRVFYGVVDRGPEKDCLSGKWEGLDHQRLGAVLRHHVISRRRLKYVSVSRAYIPLSTRYAW